LRFCNGPSEINAAADADEGEVQIQNACRLLSLAHDVDALGAYYGADTRSSSSSTRYRAAYWR
jgi:hypothetical protein